MVRDKLEIVRKYAAAHSTILSNQKWQHYVYIDAFAGLGVAAKASVINVEVHERRMNENGNTGANT